MEYISCNILQVAVNRAETRMRARLLIRPSELRRSNPRTKEYELPIGYGLLDSKLCISQGNLNTIVMKFNMLKQFLNMVGV